MKTRLFSLLFFYFILFSGVVQAQIPPLIKDGGTTPPAVNPNTIEDELQKAETTLNQYNNLKKRLDDLKEAIEKSDYETIGFLNFKLVGVTLYSGTRGGANTIVNIDSIDISIKDGYINDLTIYANNNTYTNKQAPIPITHSRFTKTEDRIYLVGGSDYFIFHEVVQPEKLSQYVPDDINFTAKVNDLKLKLRKGVGINNIFDIRLYSDALALFGNEENGLVQTDLRYKNILHRRNLRNGLFYLQYIKVNVNASKFDSKDKYIEVDEFVNSNLLRKSYFNAEASLNLLNGWIEFKSLSKAYIDAGFGIGSSRLKTDTDTLNITTSTFFIEAGLNLKSSSNIGLDVNARMMRLFSPSTQSYSEYLNKEYFNFLRFGVDFYWHPFDEKANRLFARVNYFTPTNSIDKKNDFFQFQVGYSVMLSELIK